MRRLQWTGYVGRLARGRDGAVAQSTSHDEVRLVLLSFVSTQGSRKPALCSLLERAPRCARRPQWTGYVGRLAHSRDDAVVQSTSREEVRRVTLSMVSTQGSRKPTLDSL